MKVTKTSTQPAFQPIELKITIESQEELKAMENMLSWNVSIPEIVYGTGQSNKHLHLMKLMEKFHNAIIEAQQE